MSYRPVVVLFSLHRFLFNAVWEGKSHFQGFQGSVETRRSPPGTCRRGKALFLKCSDDANTFYTFNIFRNFAIFAGVLMIQAQSGASQRSPRHSFIGQNFEPSPDNDVEIPPEAASSGCERVRRLSPHDPN